MQAFQGFESLALRKESGDLPEAPETVTQNARGTAGALTVPDPVEAALADALTKAASAGRFDVVAQLAKELEARRLARLDVVDLAARRERR